MNSIALTSEHMKTRRRSWAFPEAPRWVRPVQLFLADLAICAFLWVLIRLGFLGFLPGEEGSTLVSFFIVGVLWEAKIAIDPPYQEKS